MGSIKISSKVLRKTDMRRLSVQTSIHRYPPPFLGRRNVLVLELQDEEEKVWTFHLTIRRGRYRKPVLSAGWVHFVRSKQLQIGFMVEFFKEVNETTGEFRFKIKLKKPISVFKAVLGYSPYRAR